MSRLSTELWPARREVRLEPLPAELGSPEPWRGALHAFTQEISGWRKRVDVTMVLSNHFVRYALVPAQDGAATPEEELALARFQFAKIHGERAKAWEVRVSPERSGARLACAIDAALLSEMRGIFSRHKDVKLVSVQPWLMAAFNRSRGRIPPEGAWLLLAEREWACLARLAPRGWGSVHNSRETDWESLVERERNRAGGERLPSLVLKEQRAA